jgi:ribosomal protein S18 acetylase RimI-like enzyme
MLFGSGFKAALADGRVSRALHNSPVGHLGRVSILIGLDLAETPMTTARVGNAGILSRNEARPAVLEKVEAFARPDDGSRIVAALVLAFSADPANRWMYPSPESYLRYFPEFVRALGGRAFEHGTAYFIGDVQAAALWLPPGVQPDEEALMALFQRTLTGDHQEALGTIVEQMAHYHPDEPHWYLPWIGTDPAQQRKGLGSALLEHSLMACDQDRMPAYLEASSLESVPLYERHGFEVLGTIHVGTSPPITPMVRRPR